MGRRSNQGGVRHENEPVVVVAADPSVTEEPGCQGPENVVAWYLGSGIK